MSQPVPTPTSTSSSTRKILVTSALPYANGPIHIGHLVEYIQTDIWVRFQRLCGHQTYYIGADDAHGTPIMIKAENEGVTPEQLIARVHKEHYRDFNTFNISFDNYYSTHSEENREFSIYIFNQALKHGYIKVRTIKQAYDVEKNMFLPDRLIRGTCPKCHAEDQYGDNCEKCGSTYNSTDLINPRSTLSNTPPVEKESEHYFFDLPAMQTFLQEWTNSDNRLQKEMANKLEEWFESGLQQWDISRDAPYFGFAIPETNEQKYFYVWLDAPIGYMASFKNYCEANNLNFDDWWQADSETELHHFIGKDIVYFHALFWPAMLKVAGFRQPTKIHAHGFLTVDGQKMSKSRGTLIKAESWAKHLPPESLRYFFASRLSNRVEDIDLNLADFQSKFNTDIVGKFINIASRCSGFLNKHFDNRLAVIESDSPQQQLLKTIHDYQKSITNHYENRQYSHAIREIIEATDIVNQYINDQAPWVIAKKLKQHNESETHQQEPQEPQLSTDEIVQQTQQLHQIITTAIQSFAWLTLYLKPVLPKLTDKIEAFLNCQQINYLGTWQDDGIKKYSRLPENHQINKFSPLAERITTEAIEQVIEEETEKV